MFITSTNEGDRQTWENVQPLEGIFSGSFEVQSGPSTDLHPCFPSPCWDPWTAARAAQREPGGAWNPKTCWTMWGPGSPPSQLPHHLPSPERQRPLRATEKQAESSGFSQELRALGAKVAGALSKYILITMCQISFIRIKHCVSR